MEEISQSLNDKQEELLRDIIFFTELYVSTSPSETENRRNLYTDIILYFEELEGYIDEYHTEVKPISLEEIIKETEESETKVYNWGTGNYSLGY